MVYLSKTRKRLALGLLTIFSFANCMSCNQLNENQVTIWVASNIYDLTKQQVEEFRKTDEGKDFPYNVRLDTVSEQNAATNMILDVESGADIFVFAQDQLSRLIVAGALSRLPTAVDETQGIEYAVLNRNDQVSANAVLYKGELDDKEHAYAYPVTSDNTYFMYYNKSIIDDETAKGTITEIMDKCKDKGKLFSLSLKDGFWYSSGFFLAREVNGTTISDPLCHSHWNLGETGEFVSKDDTFASDNGVIAAKAIAQVYNHPAYNDSNHAYELGNNSAVVVSGSWDFTTAKEKLGDNFGIAPLPYFKVGDKTYHMGSFTGCKLMGVKPHTDAKKEVWCAKLANYLTNEVCQKQRFDSFNWGPSNKVAQEEVKEDQMMTVIFEQNKYATPQGPFPDQWWKFGATNIVSAIKQLGKTTITDQEAWKVLNTFKANIDTLAPDAK